MSSPIYQCRTCGSIAHIVENNTEYYCAPCVIKRDKIPVRKTEKNKKQKFKS